MAKKSVAENTKETKKLLYVNCNKLNLREEPNKESSVLALLNKDDSLVFKNKVDNVWSHVTTQDNVDGYVMTEFTR